MIWAATSSETRIWASAVEAPEVRRQEGVRGVEQRRAGRRLVLEDIHPGPTELAGSQRIGDGRLVEDAAARHVEDDRAGLHPGDRIPADQALRRLRVSGTWTVTTSARSSRASKVDQLDAVVGGLLGRRRTGRRR